MSISTAKLLASFSRRIPFPGRDRFARSLYPPDYFLDLERPLELKVPYDKGLHLLCNPSSEIEWCVFFKGYYEPDLSIFLKSFVKSGMTVFDIGANVGVHTLLTTSRVRGTGRAFAVEPNPHIRRRLKQNLQLNGFEDRVTVFSCGLSDHSGEAQFYIPAEGGSNMGISSLYPSADLPQEVRIKLRTLDSLIEETGVKRLDLIKIDTEGSDMAVLRGAQKTLDRFSPTIVVEINYEASDIADKEIADGSGLLADLGYQIFRLTRIGRLHPVDPGRRLPPGNVICKRQPAA